MLRGALVFLLILTAPLALARDPQAAVKKELGPTREAIDTALRWISTGIEVTGVGIIVVGAIAATVIFLYGGLVSVGWPAAFRRYRANLVLSGLAPAPLADKGSIGYRAASHEGGGRGCGAWNAGRKL